MARAQQIHRLAPNLITRRQTTIAVVDAVDDVGNVVRAVASSERALRAQQLAALVEGEIAVTGPIGIDAEIKALTAIQQLGLHPVSVAASRPICPQCQEYIQKIGMILEGGIQLLD